MEKKMGSFAKGFEEAKSRDEQKSSEHRQKERIAKERLTGLKAIVEQDAELLKRHGIYFIFSGNEDQLQVSMSGEIVSWMKYDLDVYSVTMLDSRVDGNSPRYKDPKSVVEKLGAALQKRISSDA